MRLSATDSIQHGLLNLRANWQLVLVQVLQTLIVTLISILGLLPVVFALGFTFLRSVVTDWSSGGATRILERIPEAWAPLLAAFVAATLIWTLAFILYCYFQGGIFGTLAAGEHRAEGSEWQSYRAFSKRRFFESAEGLTWPIFWLMNLFACLAFVPIAGLAVLMAVLFRLGGEGSEALLVGLGCLGFLVLAVFMVLLSVWMQLALAELANGTRGAATAAKAALVVAGRRLPAVALLFLLLIVTAMIVTIALTPISMVLEMATRGRIGLFLSGQALVTLAQWSLSGLVTVAWSATLVALVAGEREVAA